MRRFGLKTDIDSANFSLDSDMVFEGITVVTINVFIVQFQMNKEEREKCEFEVDLKKPFLVAVVI